MGGDVGQGLSQVVAAPDDASLAHDDGPDGHLVTFKRLVGLI